MKHKDAYAIMEAIGPVLKARKEIVAAYLFGSAATGMMGHESDIDIGIVLKSGYKARALYPASVARLLDKKLNLKTEIDVRILNDASPRFLFQVLKSGKLIMSKNEKKRVEFETYAISRYLDFKQFYEEYDRKRHERLSA